MQERNLGRTRSALALVLAALCAAGSAQAQTTDFCGCAGSPNSLGAFSTSDPATWPAGSVQSNNFFSGGCDDRILVPLPPDGVFVFDSMSVDSTSRGCRAYVVFQRNDANTPVTLLVKQDVTIGGNGRLRVDGFLGGAGSNGGAGAPGQGGPGGFAGGEGAYQTVNLANDGGSGVGPGGGLGGTLLPVIFSRGGSFVGVPELRPLLGGSGGGGGRASTGFGNSAGGGGGGGGALLVAANGTLTVDGQITADGGGGGDRTGTGTGGAGGSGGAIRLLANRIQGSGSVLARGGPGISCCGFDGPPGGAGRIRMEAIFNSFRADGTDPVALRAPAPGPLVNPITPTVRITGIDGAATPTNPIGFQNSVDMIVDAPGVIQIDLATTDVPAGTDVQVTVKPKVGAAPFAQNVTLAAGGCTSGACTAATSFDLAAGAYIVEARATFQTP